MQLLIATSNPGKVREFREMLGADRFQWTDLSAHRSITPVEETGRTFLDNACLKAAYYAKALNSWALADDSGLEVDALDSTRAFSRPLGGSEQRRPRGCGQQRLAASATGIDAR